jgi:glycosyltransferase involved in cell wall biosynthesis
MLVPWLTVGGSDKFNLDLAGGLVGRGWEVSIATTLQGDDRWLSAFAHVTPDVFCLPNFLRLTDYPRFIEHLLESRRIDTVLISNSELAYRLLPHLKPRFPDVAFVDFCHMEQEEWLDGGYPRMSIDAAPWLDRTIVLSEHLRQWMLARGRVADAVTVSHNGVEVPDDAEIARARGRQRQAWGVGDEPVLLFAGRVVGQKQPRLFGDVVCRLFASGLRFTVVVAGEGPDLPALREQLAGGGLGERARLLGAVSPSLMHEVLCASDVLCLPSAWEGMALVLHEAMACGVAVVAADVGGHRELVTPDCGTLIPPLEARALVDEYAEAVGGLLRDDERRRRSGAAGRRRIAAHFTLDAMTGRMAGLLSDAARRASDRASASSGDAARAARLAGGDERTLDRAAAAAVALVSQYQPYYAWVTAVAAGEPVPSTMTARVFRGLTVLEPLYRWGLRRGWRWLPALRLRLRAPLRRLLRLDR